VFLRLILVGHYDTFYAKTIQANSDRIFDILGQKKCQLVRDKLTFYT
jgi:hypothetical protein